MVIPYTFCTNGITSEWRWQGLDKPRLLYGLYELTRHKEKTVLVVEGAKTAEAAKRLIKNVVVVTWQGGAQAVAQTDWSPLYGRKVIIWADYDWSHKYGKNHEKAGQIKPWAEQPGNAAAIIITNAIKEHCEIIRYVHSPIEASCGWDLADAENEGWDDDTATNYMLENLFDEPDKLKPENNELTGLVTDIHVAGQSGNELQQETGAPFTQAETNLADTADAPPVQSHAVPVAEGGPVIKPRSNQIDYSGGMEQDENPVFQVCWLCQ